MRAFGTYAYRGTIVGEASHPSSATPGVDPRSGAGPASRRWSLIVPCENDPRPSGGEGRERERERERYDPCGFAWCFLGHGPPGVGATGRNSGLCRLVALDAAASQVLRLLLLVAELTSGWEAFARRETPL